MCDSLRGDASHGGSHGLHLVVVLLSTISANGAVTIDDTIDELHVDIAALRTREMARTRQRDFKPYGVAQGVDVADKLIQNGGGEVVNEVGEKNSREGWCRATGPG